MKCWYCDREMIKINEYRYECHNEKGHTFTASGATESK